MRRFALIAAVVGALLLGGGFLATGRTSEAGSGPIGNVGRYRVSFSPHGIKDTFLVDTQEGRVWRMVTAVDVPGEPSLWSRVPRLDDDAERNKWWETRQ